MPELVASLCTLLVLAPLALMPGLGEFLFRPMALAVAFAMIAAYLLSRTFVPSRSAAWLKAHAPARPRRPRRPRQAGGTARSDDANGHEPIAAGLLAGPSPAGRR